MSIRINTNIFNLLVSRNLDKSTKALESSYQRLSSGEAITKASDDPAKLATSELLRHQSRGLQQATGNINGAISLTGTAESYLGNIGSLLNRARELLVQAANDTLQPADRAAVQADLAQTTAEIQRLATSAEYNGHKLLDGSLTGTRIQVGIDEVDKVIFTLRDFRTQNLGSIATLAAPGPVTNAALAAGDLAINGIAIAASAPDGVSTSLASASALAKATAINAAEPNTGVRAEIVPATLTSPGVTGAVNINGITNSLTINGVAIGPLSVQANDGDGALVRSINAVSVNTGVTASRDASGKLVLTAPDGRNIQVVTTGGIGAALGLTGGGDINATIMGSLKLTSIEQFTLTDAAGALGLGGTSFNVATDPATALANIGCATSDDARRSMLSVDSALAAVSNGRSKCGALYARLNGMVDAIAQTRENLSKADSTIRDTDFALETARLTQSQILQEAAMAMLTQANTTPRKALEILQL